MFQFEESLLHQENINTTEAAEYASCTHESVNQVQHFKEVLLNKIQSVGNRNEKNYHNPSLEELEKVTDNSENTTAFGKRSSQVEAQTKSKDATLSTKPNSTLKVNNRLLLDALQI